MPSFKSISLPLFAACITIMILLQGCAVFGVTAGFEQPSYTVVEQSGTFEVRAYGSRTAVEARIPFSDEDPRSNAFRSLFYYITGANADEADFAMTVPVSAQMADGTQSQDADYVMRFFLPADLQGGSAPAADDARVQVVELPPQTLAVLRYSGSQSEENAARHIAELRKALAGSAWQVDGDFLTLYYNPPFSFPFLRRNEAAVAVIPR